MSKVEIKDYTDPDTSRTYKAIFVNEEVFDWYIEEEELQRAIEFAKKDPSRRFAIIGDVVDFFLQCFAQFVGKEVSLEELLEAIEIGELA